MFTCLLFLYVHNGCGFLRSYSNNLTFSCSFNMELKIPEAQTWKKIVKITLFGILSTLFFFFYFYDQTRDFLKHSTTWTSRTEEVNTFGMPWIFMCLQPRFKASIFGNRSSYLGLHLDNNSLLPSGQSNITQFLDSASYILGKDFELQFSESNEKLKNHQLKEGLNLIGKGLHMTVMPIQTLLHGKCYVITSTWSPKPSQSFMIKAKRLDETLQKVDVYLVSKESWYGIMSETWPFLQIEKNTFDFSETNVGHWMDLYVRELHFWNGQKSVDECIGLLLTNFACSNICIPFFFSSLALNLPTCESVEDTTCMFNQWFYDNDNDNYQSYKKCLKPLTTTLYKAKVLPIDKLNATGFLDILFTFGTNEKEVAEEVLMIGFSSYIGSVGGSLGLFLGFSFFTHLSCCIDKIFEICRRANSL